MSRRALLLAAVAAIAALALFFARGDGDARRRGKSDSRITGGCGRRDAPFEDRTADRGARATRVVDKTVRDVALRNATRERLRERLGDRYPAPEAARAAAPRPSSKAEPGPAPEGSASAPRIEPKYIHERVREDFFPMARQCYDEMLARKPGLGGKVALHFTIVGDEKIGGIVEETSVGDESSLRDPEFETCVTESMMAMTFPPPKGGGVVTVKYPIEFSPGDDEADAAAPKTDGGER